MRSTIGRWDDDVDKYERARWWKNALLLLTLDVTRPLACNLGLEEQELSAVVTELRQAALPYLDARARGGTPEIEEALARLSEHARALVQRFYDCVLRYREADRKTYFNWRHVLIHCTRNELWVDLGLPADCSRTILDAFESSLDATETQDKLDRLLDGELSIWDARIAVLRIFPPIDDDNVGICDTIFNACMKIVREQRFWKQAASLLGEQGLQDLHAHAEAIARRIDRLRIFTPLYDPWLLAHPEMDAQRPRAPSSTSI